MADFIRGVQASQEQKPAELIRDTRTLGRRIYDFLSNSVNAAVLLLMMAVLAQQLPGIADIIFVSEVFYVWFCLTRKPTLPFRLPMRSNTTDYNDLIPGSSKTQKARGIYFFGNERVTNEELWFNNDDMRTHALIFGSTGSGKTEALISIALNSLIQGSGFIYIDGKGDNSLFTKIFSMCRRMGREDDLLLINFMTGARDVVGPQEKRLSNTMNPFASGSSSMLSQLVVSMMDSSSNSPDGDMWKGRAIVFVEALMKILVYMRDQGKVLLDANTIRNYFALDRLEAIVMDRQFPRDKLDPVSLADVPDVAIEPIQNYVYNLPGYDKTRKGRQVSQVLEQHGFITMQLTRVFGSLADTYGHIIRTNLPEVDMRDVVLNRRILVVLLPALEKSPDELANLGKIIVASLKVMMAAGLGDDVEGSYRDIIQRKPTNSPTPFLCIMDEYGFYAVKGFAVVPAQARSLGFSAIFAGQDLPAFERVSKEEAMSIGANTNIKICMKLEDPMETWEFFQKAAGEAFVTKVDAFQTRAESMTNTYLDTRSSSVEKRGRVDMLDLKDQREGEAHIFFRSKIVRAQLFYANPPPIPQVRLNQLLKVEPPKARLLLDLEQSLVRFQQTLSQASPALDVDEISSDDEAAQFLRGIKKDTLDESPNWIESSIQALRACVDADQEEEAPILDVDIPGTLSIFSPFPESERSIIQVDDIAQFSRPLLDAKLLREKSIFIERLSNSDSSNAAEVAQQLVDDMRFLTHYPPMLPDFPSADYVAEVVRALSERLIEVRE